MAKAIRRVALLLAFSLLILASTVGVASSQAGNWKYDADRNGLIEVSNLEQLDAIRYDLDGDGSPDPDSDVNKYVDAFPTSGTEAVCESGCNGYELTRSLDFDNAGSYASGAVNTAWTAGKGWEPIGDKFDTTFDGSGHTISNLYINRIDSYNVGLFSLNDLDGIIRNIGLVDVDVSGKSGGGLAGFNLGTISDSYASGDVSGSETSAGGLVGLNGSEFVIGGSTISHSYASVAVSGADGSAAGGLVGRNDHGTIIASYATGSVLGGSPVGGLAGYHWGGTIISSYASGSVEASYIAGGLVGRGLSGSMGEGDGWVISSYATGNVKGGVGVGGLVGSLLHPSWHQRGGNPPSKIGVIASYATGSVEGDIQVGGLVGSIFQNSDASDVVTITASYATGNVQGNRSAGGLIGGNSYKDSDAAGGTTVSSSYWDTETSGQATAVGQGDSTGVQGQTTAQLQSPIGYTGIYSAWGADLDNADGDDNSATGTDNFWDFGTSSQYPALKADLDGNGTPTWQEFGGQRPTPPPPPGAPTAMAEGPTRIDLSWSSPNDNGGGPITAYDLRHIETGAADKSDANWTLKEDVWTTGGGTLQYSLTGLTGSTEYDVQVRAVNAAGESEWSATVTETTAPPTAPEAPTGLTARVVSGEARVVLSWTAPANTGGAPITGYKIEASDDGNTSWTEVHTTAGDVTSYTDEGDEGDGPVFEVGEVRYYRVAAVNSVGEGAPSSVAKAEDLVARYDADGDNMIDKAEVIAAINDYLFGDGDEAISKAEVIELINLYLFG